MNIKIQGTNNIFGNRGMKSVQDRMERQAKRDNQIAFLEQRKSHLKDMKTDSIEDISTYTYAGVTYTLTKIMVDGVQVEQGSFNSIVESNRFSDIANSDHDIKLYYAIATAAED